MHMDMHTDTRAVVPCCFRTALWRSAPATRVASGFSTSRPWRPLVFDRRWSQSSRQATD